VITARQPASTTRSGSARGGDGSCILQIVGSVRCFLGFKVVSQFDECGMPLQSQGHGSRANRDPARSCLFFDRDARDRYN
jgi:hypothetical protein